MAGRRIDGGLTDASRAMTETDSSIEVEDLWGGEVLGGLDPLGLLAGLRAAFSRPDAVVAETVKGIAELVRITAGHSTVEPDPRDARFANPAWTDNPAYRRIAQAYLTWGSGMQRLADGVDGDWQARRRSRFATDLLVSALAPTNVLPTNPAALERAFETGGASVIRGARNFVEDVRTNRGMPRSVDREPFRVGETVAVTPGAVVYRDELIELIQYEPTTPEVLSRPVVLVPPQINKFWFMDMAPGRSLVEYGVGRGIQMFVISWRNPETEHGHWSLDDYVAALDRAADVAMDITGADGVGTISLCAGGMTTAAWLGHLAAAETPKSVGSAFGVTMLDFSGVTGVGMFGVGTLATNARKASARAGVLDGHELAMIFAALRPDDMIWRYWVNNYLLGNDPPAFDLLAWNADPSRLPAGLHGDFVEVMVENAFAHAGALKVLGTPIDLAAVDVDVFGVGAEKDHLTPWGTCYDSLQLFGGSKEFVQSSSGHIQSLVNPPGNGRMWYRTGPPPEADADAWVAATTQHTGSWWERWGGPARQPPPPAARTRPRHLRPRHVRVAS
jgi:polyhydroxyalkanoate synthase